MYAEGETLLQDDVICGMGTDLVEVEAIARALQRGKGGFAQRIFTEEERNYCEERRWKFQHYAGRFAAKEAFFKALGSGWRKGLGWKEVEVMLDGLGKPHLQLHGKTKAAANRLGAQGLHLSISHTRQLAIATVILTR